MTERSEDEIKATAFKLRTEKRMTLRQIADELGIALGTVAGFLKGVPATGATQEVEPERKTPPFMPMLITRERVAKFYALALDEKFEDVNKWIDEVLLPWYAVKRDFEWKLRIKIVPSEFAAYIETAMADSVELKQMKEHLASISHPTQAVATPMPAVQPSTTDKGEVKPS